MLAHSLGVTWIWGSATRPVTVSQLPNLSAVYRRAYGILNSKGDAMERQVNEMLSKYIIEPSQSRWGFSALLVQMPDSVCESGQGRACFFLFRNQVLPEFHRRCLNEGVEGIGALAH